MAGYYTAPPRSECFQPTSQSVSSTDSKEGPLSSPFPQVPPPLLESTKRLDRKLVPAFDLSYRVSCRPRRPLFFSLYVTISSPCPRLELCTFLCTGASYCIGSSCGLLHRASDGIWSTACPAMTPENDDVVDLWVARNDCYLSSLVSRFSHIWLATWLYLRRLGEERGSLYLDPSAIISTSPTYTQVHKSACCHYWTMRLLRTSC